MAFATNSREDPGPSDISRDRGQPASWVASAASPPSRRESPWGIEFRDEDRIPRPSGWTAWPARGGGDKDLAWPSWCLSGAAPSGSLALEGTLSVALGVALLLPAGAVGWSVQRTFGLARAAGADHFRARYRELPLETRGALRWTPNAMYVIAFLGLWSIALIGRSHLALVAALLQHAYIWVHHLSVERPDMELIYRP